MLVPRSGAAEDETAVRENKTQNRRNDWFSTTAGGWLIVKPTRQFFSLTRGGSCARKEGRPPPRSGPPGTRHTPSWTPKSCRAWLAEKEERRKIMAIPETNGGVFENKKIKKIAYIHTRELIVIIIVPKLCCDIPSPGLQTLCYVPIHFVASKQTRTIILYTGYTYTSCVS